MEKLELRGGHILVDSLLEGKLVIAEYQGDRSSLGEISTALKTLGISFGLLTENIQLMAEGGSGQLPVAQAYLDLLPGKIRFLPELPLNKDGLEQVLRDSKRPQVDVIHNVQEGEVLADLTSNFQAVIQYPNGYFETVSDLPPDSLSYFAGENVRYEGDTQDLRAKCDGYASRDVFGIVTVHPAGELPSILRIHGKINVPEALLVKGDIGRDCDVTCTGNLAVRGMIRSARVVTQANLFSQVGLKKSDKKTPASATVSRNLFTPHVSHFMVDVGHRMVVRNHIDHSNVRCNDLVVCPTITASTIRVGYGLIARNLRRCTRIFLGPEFVKDSGSREKESELKQHKNRLSDVEQGLLLLKERIQQEQGRLVGHIRKMQRLGETSIRSDILLAGLYKRHTASIEEYGQITSTAKRVYELIRRDWFQINYFRQNQPSGVPEIVVVGNLEPGTVIKSRNDEIKFDKLARSLRIRLSPEDGKLTATPLN